MKLFLDDTRIPRDVGYQDAEWTIVRDYATFKVILDNFGPEEISFDHDLADFSKNQGIEKEWTGLDCAKYLVERDSKWNMITPDFKWKVHSYNPVGKKNIEEYLKCYIKFKLDNKERK